LVGAVAFLGGILGKRSGQVQQKEVQETGLRCAHDGTRIKPLYQVDAYLDDGTMKSFCSVYCAGQWFQNNKDNTLYFTVMDEMTGERFDSTLGFFVESDVVTVPEVKNRIHVFAVKQDALTHAQQYNGKLIENPFGEAFVLPKVAQFDRLAIGAPDWPDAVPLKLAVFRPIFKENRLNVQIVSYTGEEGGRRLLSGGSVEGLICDLPMALAQAQKDPQTRIVKNVLRANPFRALFAVVAGPESTVRDLDHLKGKSVAVPKGLSFRFYMEFHFGRAGVPLDQVLIREVGDVAEAWQLLSQGEVAAAVLRTPYTDMAAARKLTYLADDRNLPWMSVLVLRQSSIEEKFDAIRRFIFGLEQSVLALNLKPDEFRTVLEEGGGVPEKSRKDFPMPIFEGANAPSGDEIAAVVQWLEGKGLLKKDTPYGAIINARFLPNPDDVGLAFCCR
jgi:ABC-type nitrate/sulfonate/bicarbonate transport system substrate-binding protein